MFKRVVILLVILLWVFAFTQVILAGQKLSVERMEIALDIVDLEPVNAGKEFSADVEELFCFTQIKGAEGETTIKHVWYYENELVAEIELPVKSPLWRTYSAKKVLSSWTGDWTVDVFSAEGEILKSMTFTVK